MYILATVHTQGQTTKENQKFQMNLKHPLITAIYLLKSVKLLTYSKRGVKSFLTGNIGTEGQRAANLLSV